MPTQIGRPPRKARTGDRRAKSETYNTNTAENGPVAGHTEFQYDGFRIDEDELPQDPDRAQRSASGQPPRGKPPRGTRGKGRRIRSAATGPNSNEYEHDLAQSEADKDATAEGQQSVADIPSAETYSEQAHKIVPTPLRFKKHRQDTDINGNHSASDNPRRPSTHKVKSQTKTPRESKANFSNSRHELPQKPTTPSGFFDQTPSKLYAGPNFHASPAASSLPLPKFFSKSVPNVDKVTSLTSMLEQEKQSSTSNSDETPSKGAVTPEPIRTQREESPLDVLFRADRQARVQGTQARPNALTDRQRSSASYLTPSAEFPLGPRTTRHHTRHHTDSSTNGIFPLEMDKAPSQPLEHSPAINFATRTITSATKTNDKPVDSQNGQSAALTKLLNFNLSQPQKSDPQKVGGLTEPATPSPKPKMSRSSARLSGTPPLFPNGLDGLVGKTNQERQAALLALAEKQISMPPYPTSQRPPSSSLRKEMKMPESPVTSQNQHPPSTPTPFAMSERQGSWPKNQRAPATTGHISTIPTVHSGNAQPSFASPTKDRQSSMKSMEDDLRRILKLDVLTSEGVGGVRS